MGYVKKYISKKSITLRDLTNKKNVILPALKEFSDDLSDFLNPIDTIDMPVLCMGLLTAYKTLKEKMPPELKIVEEILEQDIKSKSTVIKCGGKKE